MSHCFYTDVSTTFTEVVLEACLLPTVLPDKFGLDCTMLVAIMHSHIGNEVGECIDNRNTCTQAYTHTCAFTNIHTKIYNIGTQLAKRWLAQRIKFHHFDPIKNYIIEIDDSGIISVLVQLSLFLHALISMHQLFILLFALYAHIYIVCV